MKNVPNIGAVNAYIVPTDDAHQVNNKVFFNNYN